MLQKALVVNDNEILLMIAGRVINLAHFAQETVSVTDGLQALSLFDALIENNEMEQAPEFIFLDLHMPVMDGWEFLEAFTNNYADKFPKIKIAILSASVEMADMLLLDKYPIVIDFVATPITEAALISIERKYASIFQAC